MVIRKCLCQICRHTFFGGGGGGECGGVPSHVGIRGNQKAESAATSSLDLPRVRFGVPYISLVYPISVWRTLYQFCVPYISLVYLISVWRTLYQFGVPYISLTYLKSVWCTLYQFGVPCISKYILSTWQTVEAQDVPIAQDVSLRRFGLTVISYFSFQPVIH